MEANERGAKRGLLSLKYVEIRTREVEIEGKYKFKSELIGNVDYLNSGVGGQAT